MSTHYTSATQKNGERKLNIPDSSRALFFSLCLLSIAKTQTMTRRRTLTTATNPATTPTNTPELTAGSVPGQQTCTASRKVSMQKTCCGVFATKVICGNLLEVGHIPRVGTHVFLCYPIMY